MPCCAYRFEFSFSGNNAKLKISMYVLCIIYYIHCTRYTCQTVSMHSWSPPPCHLFIGLHLSFLGFLVQFLACFSLYNNFPKIMVTKQPASAITCLHGMRVLSISWVILGHTYSFLRAETGFVVSEYSSK